MKINKPIITMELSLEERETLKEANKIWDEIITEMAKLDVESIADDYVEFVNKWTIEDFLDRTTDLLDITTLQLL